MTKKYYLFLILWALCGISNAQNKIIAFNNPNIFYEGRILFGPDAAELTWPATSVSIYFEGTGISAILKDLDTANYYNVIIDEKYFNKFHTDTVKQAYILASGLPGGKHKAELFKRTEWDKGKTLFYGFETDEKTGILPVPQTKKRKMEFFGNSITCGYGNEDSGGNDSWFGYFQNAYMSYASITARHFNAQCYSTSRSGIGIMVSWAPLIMPEMYGRLDPTDSTSKWDFSKYIPDIVVINLFQNDSWLVKNHDYEEFKRRFGTTEPDENFIINAYKNFVSTIRNKYPEAHIICALGSMDATREGSPWPEYIQKAVKQLEDKKIYTHFFPYNNANRHPVVKEHQEMADSLIEFIEKNIGW
jgi:hypothetical protein